MTHSKKISLLFPGSLIIRVIISFTIIAVASRSFIYIDKLYYFVPVAFIYPIVVIVYEKENRKLFVKSILFYLPFGLWAALTSVWSSYPFVSLSRGLYFLLMSLAVVSIIILLKKYKLNFFSVLLPLNLFVVIVSLVSLILGYPDSSWTGGNGLGFMGFAAHQNTLGALILFAIPAPVYFLITKEKYRLAFFTLLLTNMGLIFLSHSRASLLALVIFIVILAYLVLKPKIFFSAAVLTIILLAALFFNTYSNTFTKQFLLKQQNNFGDSRYYLFDASYRAAGKNPFFGMGYGISDPRTQVAAAGSHFENGRYIREKGNSTLALVEETGLFGLLLFLIPSGFLLYKYKDLFFRNSLFGNTKSFNIKTIVLIVSSVVMFLVHSQFEAWIPGVTGFHLFIFLTFTLYPLVTIETE